jgi:hypothetical protein
MLGPEVPAMTKGSFDRFVIAARRLRTPAALAAEPVDALSGVSAGDREALTAALGIRTVGDLAANRPPATQMMWASSGGCAG